MAQAILDLHASADDAAALEEGEIPSTHWSGIDIDNIHIKNTTYTKMERPLQQAVLRGFCPVTDCDYRTVCRPRMTQHIESHFILYICSCSYLRSYRNTTTKHGRTHHHDEKPAVMQVDADHWHIARRFIAGMPDATPVMPARQKDPRHDCIPNRRNIALIDHKIPKVSVAAVAMKAMDNRSVGNLASVKILKVSPNTLMTHIEARHR